MTDEVRIFRGPGAGKAKASWEKKQRYLTMLMAGRTLKEARDELGMPRATYLSWRSNDPDFKYKVDAILSGRPTEDAAANATFVECRRRWFKHATYFHQAKMVDAIETAPAMGVTLILLPPETGKSTTLHDYICYRLGRDHNMRVTYLSQGQGLARKALGRVKRRLTDLNSFTDFIAECGPFHQEGRDDLPWNADYITVMGSTHDEADYSLEARGWTGAIAGTRSDLFIIDDIQSRGNLAATDKIVEVFRQDFLSRPGRQGRTIIIGTRVGVGDFYEAILEAGLVDKVVALPATTGELVECDEYGAECPLVYPNGDPVPHEKSLCPEMWPAHALAMKRKQVGEEAWLRNYQQRPRQAGESTFTEAMTDKACNSYRALGDLSHPLLSGYRAMSLDPSLTGGNALTCWDLDPKRMCLIDVSRRFQVGQTESILAELEMWAWKYKPRVLVVEINAFQKGLATDERLMAMAGHHGFRIEPHTTGLNKIDESFGVASMDTMFTTEQVDFPFSDEHTKNKVRDLISELHNWRPGPTKKVRQDIVMSMWFAWLLWTRIKASLDESNGPNWGRQGSPGYKPRQSGLLVGAHR